MQSYLACTRRLCFFSATSRELCLDIRSYSPVSCAKKTETCTQSPPKVVSEEPVLTEHPPAETLDMGGLWEDGGSEHLPLKLI